MGIPVQYMDIGLIAYRTAWDYQEKLFDSCIQAKISGESPDNYLIFCEHPHVFTLGKSGQESNLLIGKDLLQKHQASLVKTNRGGDITYHGPGQIVGYPILNLEAFQLGVKDYVHKLEEMIIASLKSFGIQATGLEGATGVWMDADQDSRARKICAMGVRASRYITMHGFALNVNTDLSYYNLINPCGFTDKGVTSMQQECHNPFDMGEVKKVLKNKFTGVFGATLR